MKTKIIMGIIFVISFSGLAFADLLISLNDGTVFKWKAYTETSDSYCMPNNDGDFCVYKSDIISVTKVKNKEEDIKLNKESKTKVQSTPMPTKRLKAYYKTKSTPSEY